MPIEWKRLLIISLLLASLVSRCPSQTAPTASATSAWKLVWSDEFSGPDGTPIDRSKWMFDIGGEGWGNEELEFYTDRADNAYIQNGNLVIKAIAEKYTDSKGVTRNYTSARLKTFGKFSQTYGRFEARIKVPHGQGMWPAFWMLGDDIEKVGWPACGEIDIMENIGKEPSMVHGSIHGPGYVGTIGIEAPYTLPGNRRFSDDFHLFAIEWDRDSVSFFVDQDMYVRRTRADLKPGWEWVFNKPYFLILNLAVGGDWPGDPNSTTALPGTMLVDYVRVYERQNPAQVIPGKR